MNWYHSFMRAPVDHTCYSINIFRCNASLYYYYIKIIITSVIFIISWVQFCYNAWRSLSVSDRTERRAHTHAAHATATTTGRLLRPQPTLQKQSSVEYDQHFTQKTVALVQFHINASLGTSPLPRHAPCTLDTGYKSCHKKHNLG